MSKSDYYRPSENQITHHYLCRSCRREVEVPSWQSVGDCCGQAMMANGESYPASSDDWDEERGPDGEWRERS